MKQRMRADHDLGLRVTSPVGLRITFSPGCPGAQARPHHHACQLCPGLRPASSIPHPDTSAVDTSATRRLQYRNGEGVFTGPVWCEAGKMNGLEYSGMVVMRGDHHVHDGCNPAIAGFAKRGPQKIVGWQGQGTQISGAAFTRWVRHHKLSLSTVFNQSGLGWWERITIDRW